MEAVYFFYQEGQEFTNKNGSTYKVLSVISQTELVLLRTDGWQLVAHTPVVYMIGGKLRMEWDYSTGGHFTKSTINL